MKSHLEAVAILQGRQPPARSSKQRRPAPIPYAVVNAVVIGVDPGSRCSGWSIRIRDRLIGFGDVFRLDPAEIDRVIHSAERFAEIAGAGSADGRSLPVVLVVEKPPPANVIFKGRTPDAVASVYAARGAWLNAWKRAGYPPRRAVGVPVATWRAAVLGRGWGGGKARAEVTDRERLLAAVDVRINKLAGEPGADACPAILISAWGARAAVVHKALAPRARGVVRGHGFQQGGRHALSK